MSSMSEYVNKAIEICGSQSALARACGVSQPTAIHIGECGKYRTEEGVYV